MTATEPVTPGSQAGAGRRGGGDGRGERQRSAPVRGLLPLAGLLAVWQLAGSPRSPYFPTPSSWVEALVDLWGSGALQGAVIATMRTFALGLVLASLAGMTLGLVVGALPAVDRALNPSFEFARAMPPAALVPVATLLLGFDETMKVVVVVLAAAWPVLLNTRTAVRGIDATLLDTAMTLRLGTAGRLRKVIVPALLPAVFTGVRVAVPFALVITLLVEILTQLGGVGGLIAHAQQTFRPARLYGLIVVAGLLSLAVNTAVEAFERFVFRYRRGAS